MNKNLIYLEEPKLLFGYSQETEDPRDGLTLFGPYETISSYGLQAGVIATEHGLRLYESFVNTLQKPLLSSTIQRPTFPGFETVFGIKWPPKPEVVRLIDENTLLKNLSISNLKERTHRLVNLFLEPIKQVHAEEETKVDLWFIIVPKKVWLDCRPKSRDGKPSSVDVKGLKAYRAGQQVLFPEIEEEYKAASIFLDYSSDFHHQLKARLLKERINIPAQLILEPTLEFKDKNNGLIYEDEMKAHLAWTQASTIYYKLGKLPWKLQGVRRGVCYLGLVFKQFERLEARGYACSAAQMFLDSGDGTVFKGNIGPWRSKTNKDFHLDNKSAKELLTKALLSYLSKKGEYPSEVFIHGRAAFTDEEWDGFHAAITTAKARTRLVGVVIQESDKLKLFRDVLGQDCHYGNLRGLGFVINDYESFLWTRGFVPRLNTSMSLEIPNPLRIQVRKGEADIIQVMRDIMALSKLNYNACIYADGLPVTLRFSDAIGSILTAVDGIDTEVLPFKYYI